MQLRPHQQKTVNEAPDKYGLWFRQRVGKTATAIKLADTRARNCLIISPKSVKKNWVREVNNWKASDCVFYVVSKEDVRLGKIPSGCEAIIVDEAHMAFGNYQSKTYKALERYIKTNDCKYVWLLTGTPMTATNWSIYSYGKLLGKDWNWMQWRNHFNVPIKMGNRIIWQPKKGMEKELQETLKKIGTVIDLKDIADIADDEDIFEYFCLNAAQKAAIKLSFDPMPIIRYTRQHQIESGSLKGDEYNETKYYECDKDKRIKELVEQNDKTIIVTRYLANLNKYEQQLIPTGKRIFKISGQEKRTASEIATEAEECDNCVVIIQSDTVAGYNLQSFSLVIFASMSYSFVNYDQVRFRTKNMDKSTGCTYVHLLTDGDSIDQAIYDSIKNKQNFSIELYEQKRS